MPRPGSRGTFLVIVLIVLALAALLPAPASAQLQDIAVDLSCSGGPDTIQPLAQPGTWDCIARFQYKSASTGLTDPTQPAIVALEFPEHPDWIRPIVAPSQLVSFGGGAANEVVEIPFEVSVALTADAPAFETRSLWVHIDIVQHPREEGELSVINSRADTNLTVTPGYVSLYNVRMEAVKDEARPQEALEYRINIENFSNGPTRFEFSLPTEATGGFQPLVPDPIVVPGRTSQVVDGGPNATSPDGNATGNATATTRASASTASVPFQVYTPYRNGYIDERVALQLQVDTFFAPDTSIVGTSSVLTTLGHAKGAYTPGLAGPVVAILAAASALLVSRREV